MATRRPDDWDLARLRLFVTVAEECSLTRAAALTGTPQPAVSRQIAKLEQECGGRLFLRTGRGVSLSPLGERVLPKARAVLQGARDLRDELEEGIKAPRGNVRIGALPSLYLSIVVPLFQKLRERMPGVHLHVFEGSAGQIDQWLATGFIDIGLPYRYGKHVADVETLVSVSSYLVGPADDALVGEETVAFSRLDGLPLVMPSAPSGVRLLMAQLARKADIQLNVVMDADSTQIQKAVARSGGAYAVLPVHTFADDLHGGAVAAARIVDPCIDRFITMGITSARPPTQAVREVAKAIRRLAQRNVVDSDV
jgi:LysR family nitrogen assimilation transcriptional regulator